MRGMILLAAVAALGLPAMTQAAEPISKRQARAMPPAQFNARAMDQIADLLVAEERDGAAKPTRPLSHETFYTTPRTTHLQGLCRVDQLSVDFAPTGGRGKGVDQPAKASGFTAQAFFTFVVEPPAEARFHSDLFGKDDAPFVPETAPCAGVEYAGGPYFAAESERDAADGYLILRKMITEAPKADWTWTCGDAGADCAAKFEGARAGDVGLVDRCDSNIQLTQCFRYWLGDLTVRIVATLPTSKMQNGELVPQPMKILQVEARESMILVHEVID